MPQLIDLLGKMTVSNKTINSSEIYSRASMLPNKFPRPDLTVKNRLKTSIQFGDETLSKPYREAGLGEGLFASWKDELNKQPKTDCFELSPISSANKSLKSEENELEEEVRQLAMEIKLNEWKKNVDARIRMMRIHA